MSIIVDLVWYASTARPNMRIINISCSSFSCVFSPHYTQAINYQLGSGFLVYGPAMKPYWNLFYANNNQWMQNKYFLYSSCICLSYSCICLWSKSVPLPVPGCSLFLFYILVLFFVLEQKHKLSGVAVRPFPSVSSLVTRYIVQCTTSTHRLAV